MFKNIPAVIAASLFLSGCGDIPQTAGEMRTASNPMIAKSSVMVSRSPNTVAAALDRGARQCLNRDAELNFRRATQYGIQSTTIRHYYRSQLRRAGGGRSELMIYKTTTGAITPGAPDGRHLAYLVDVIPAGGGTRLNIYGGKMGYGDLNASVVQWANGNAARCPNLP